MLWFFGFPCGGGSVHICKHTLRELVSMDGIGVWMKVGIGQIEELFVGACQLHGNEDCNF